MNTVELFARPLSVDPPALRPRRSAYGASWSSIVAMLRRELVQLKARSAFVELQVREADIRNDGWIRSTARPGSPYVRVSFESCYGPLLYEAGTWASHEHNIYAVARTLAAQRAIARDGCVKGDQVYRGWKQLPGGGSGSAHPPATGTFANREQAAEVIVRVAYPDVIEDRGHFDKIMHSALGRHGYRDDLDIIYRSAARTAHPDAGGSNELMAKVNAARDYLERTRVGGGGA